jgi:hypothetical protein
MHALGARLTHTSSIADAMRSTFAEQLPTDYYTTYPGIVSHVQPPKSQRKRCASIRSICSW